LPGDTFCLIIVSNGFCTSHADALSHAPERSMKTSVCQKVLSMLACVFFLIVATSRSDSAEAPATKTAESPAVELKIVTWDEFQAWLKQQQGNIVVVDCWATYCAPCKKEFPHLVELSKKHANDKVKCVSLSFDFEETNNPDKTYQPVREFLSKMDARFTNLLVKLDADELHEKMGLTSIPGVFVYDAQGKLHKLFDNSEPGKQFTYEQVGAAVVKLLNP
jgi:thiol-disulfide isomerase/thioredoxin